MTPVGTNCAITPAEAWLSRLKTSLEYEHPVSILFGFPELVKSLEQLHKALLGLSPTATMPVAVGRQYQSGNIEAQFRL